MPFKRSRKYSAKKRYSKPSRRLYRSRRKMMRKKVRRIPNSPFPNTYWCQLRFAQQIALTCTAGAQQYNSFRLNSLYDPDYTGIGQQPRFFDTLCGASAGTAPYGSYRVHACKWKVNFVNTNSSQNSIAYIAARVRDQDTTVLSSAITDYNIFRETPNTKVKMLMNGTNNLSSKWLNGFTKIKSVLSMKDLRDDSDTAAAYNANPAEQVFLDVHVRPQDTTTTATFQIFVTLIFFCEFFDRNTTAQS